MDSINNASNISRPTTPVGQASATVTPADPKGKKPEMSEAKAKTADTLDSSSGTQVPTSLPQAKPQTLPEATQGAPEAPKSNWRISLEAKINSFVERGKAFVAWGKTTVATVVQKGRDLLHEVAVFLSNFSKMLADIARGTPSTQAGEGAPTTAGQASDKSDSTKA